MLPDERRRISTAERTGRLHSDPEMLIPRLPPPPQTFWQRNGSAVQFGLLLAGVLAAAVAFGLWQARASLESVHRAERLDQGP